MARGALGRRPEAARATASGSTADATRPARRVETEIPAHSHRQGGPSEDRALYNCGCGYVFAALVSTTVDCPHCGDAQAW
jgi:hypothetical protein